MSRAQCDDSIEKRTVSLFREPQANESVKSERRITNPREAVIPANGHEQRQILTRGFLCLPVPRPPNILRQAERRASDDRSRGFVDEQLERESAPVDGLLPRPGVG